MENYVYNGCVMAVQAENSGLPAMLLPNATVQADPEHPYVKRLVARGLLTASIITVPEVVPSYLTGFRFRTICSFMSKSEQLHTYNPNAIGSNGEKVINLANLFNDSAMTGNGSTNLDSNGWSEWSRPLTFEDVNYPSSNGGVTLVYNKEESPNYWMDMNGITDLNSFFARLASTSGFVGSIDYKNFG